ncbi:hypothetical protein H8959_018187 [Pygathrix nigripes]
MSGLERAPGHRAVGTPPVVTCSRTKSSFPGQPPLPAPAPETSRPRARNSPPPRAAPATAPRTERPAAPPVRDVRWRDCDVTHKAAGGARATSHASPWQQRAGRGGRRKLRPLEGVDTVRLPSLPARVPAATRFRCPPRSAGQRPRSGRKARWPSRGAIRCRKAARETPGWALAPPRAVTSAARAPGAPAAAAQWGAYGRRPPLADAGGVRRAGPGAGAAERGEPGASRPEHAEAGPGGAGAGAGARAGTGAGARAGAGSGAGVRAALLRPGRPPRRCPRARPRRSQGPCPPGPIAYCLGLAPPHAAVSQSSLCGPKALEGGEQGNGGDRKVV